MAVGAGRRLQGPEPGIWIGVGQLCGGGGHGVEHRHALGGTIDSIEHEAMQIDVKIGGARAPHLIDERRVLRHEPAADPVQHLCALLRFGVDGDKTHPEAADRLTDRRGIVTDRAPTHAETPVAGAGRKPVAAGECA
jgi:hypothetical protein